MGDIIPTSGNVYFNLKININNEIKSIKGNVHTETGIQLLRAIQSYVPQEAFIMSSTIRENIPLKYRQDNHSYVNDSEIINSLYVASFKTDLKQLDNGLDTEIGERGVNLSGGQKQRVSLSRSAFANSSFIILDDPLSAVDVKTEKELVQNIFLGEWGYQKTIIWATHRLEFLNHSHSIIFIDSGKLLEQGKYSDLIKNKNSRLNQFLLGLNNYGKH